MFVLFSFRPALSLACALIALTGSISRVTASELEESTTSAALAFPAPPSATDPTLPANITVPSTIAPVMRDMLDASPTFRRQCARIARATEGRVEITIQKPRSVQYHGMSMIRHGKSRTWTATVEVFISNDLPELLAHELEHVIEYIDGVDLPRLAQQGLAGVARSGSELYETARAIATGKRVRSEFEARRDQRAHGNERSGS
jgi:hypothetical protein